MNSGRLAQAQATAQKDKSDAEAQADADRIGGEAQVLRSNDFRVDKR